MTPQRLLLLSLWLFATGLSASPVSLPGPEGAPLPIVLPSSSEKETDSATAHILAEQLGRIFSVPFPVVASAKGAAIRLGIQKGDNADALSREDYTIRTSERGIDLVGSTALALRHAVWDLLHRLGYRQFFPGPTWEIVPEHTTFVVDLDVSESPDYASRRIWYGYGLSDHNRTAYSDWIEKNRMGGGFALNTGHAYGRLIRAQQAVFDAHPEYYALVDGKRHIHPDAKLCIANPGVHEAAIAYALAFFAENPDADSVSMDPSDGGGWCECEDCARLGPPNDRATILANAVAEALVAKLGPTRYVGMYAYAYHSEPPRVKVHSNLIVSVATGFIKGGHTVEAILAGWAKQGAALGIREYYSVNTWDRDLPGAARGGNLDYLAKTIPAFRTTGARFITAESSDNWGPNGLGYYLASRMMWDVREASRREAILSDFLESAFGPAAEPMREFYQRIDGANQAASLVYDDLLARMFRLLDQAKTLATADPSIGARLDALILWTRHAELYDRYRRSSGPERQAAFQRMLEHAWRIRGTMMVHSYALYRDVDNRDKDVSIPAEAAWSVPEPKNPWKSSTPFDPSEISTILREGIASHTPVELDFEPVVSDDSKLVPARDHLPLPKGPVGTADSGRGKRSWLTLVNDAPAQIVLDVTGGLIEHYRDRGNVRISLWKIGGASATGERETLVAEDASVPPDGVERRVILTAKEAGLHRIDLDDGNDLTRITWPDGQIMSWKMSLEEHPDAISGRWTLTAWVPKGTRVIGLYSAANVGELVDADGKRALDLAAKGGRFLSVPVAPGMDGRFWKFRNVAGRVALLSIPPYLARTPAELLIPQP